eukprot:3897201-Pyramimonas_sp.AAC.1
MLMIQDPSMECDARPLALARRPKDSDGAKDETAQAHATISDWLLQRAPHVMPDHLPTLFA